MDCHESRAKIHKPRPIVVPVRQDGGWVLGSNFYLISWQLRSRNECAPELVLTSTEAWIDADQWNGIPELRPCFPGDRFSPPGLRSRHRKLKKYFQESGIPRSERGQILVVALDDEVLWIPGFAVSGNYQVQAKTKTVIELRLECRRKTQ